MSENNPKKPKMLCMTFILSNMSLTDFAKNSFLNSYTNIGHTALINSICLNESHVTKFLIENGANVNQHELGRRRQSPLHVAVILNRVECFKILMENGANKESLNIECRTPIFYACTPERVEILPELIKAGADINIKDIYGNTPLYYATLNNCPSEVLQLLTNVLYLFISECCDVDPISKPSEKIHTTELGTFRMAFKQYCNISNVRQPPWNQTLISSVFEKYQITICKPSMNIVDRFGQTKPYLLGIRFKENHDDVEKNLA